MVRSGGQGVYLCSTFLVAPARNAPYEDGWARIHTANALGFNPFSGVPLLVSATAGVDQEGAAPAKPDNAD